MRSVNKVFTEDLRTGETLKRCSKCGVYKGLGEYRTDMSRSHGVQPTCKTCRSAAYRRYENGQDLFWKRFHARVQKVGKCLEWMGSYGGGCKLSPRVIYERKTTNLRRLIYRLSVGELPDNMLVVPICRNHRCVRALHLSLMSPEEHYAYAANNCRAMGDRNGSRLHPEKVPRGESHGMARLTEEKVREIRELASTLSKTQIAHDFGVSRQTVSDVIARKRWTHI